MTEPGKFDVPPTSLHFHCRNYTGAFITVSMLVALLFVADFYLLSKLEATQSDERELRAGLGKGMADLHGQNQDLLRKYVLLRDSHANEIAQLRGELDQAAGQLDASSRRVLDRARRIVSVLETEQNRQAGSLEDQIAQKADLEDLDGLQQGITSAGSRIGTTERTMGELAKDLGVARTEWGEFETNTKQQVETLQGIAEGECHDFNLQKNRPFHVGGIVLNLRKTNPHKQVFNLDVVSNDRDIRHDGHNIDEPIYFYVDGSRVRYEVVVTWVGAEGAAGYIRVPKQEGSEEVVTPRT